MDRAKTVLVLVVAMLAAMPAAASAHAGNPNYRSVIDRVTPTVPDVSFEVLSYDSYMQLLDQHGHEVVIYGYEGEPYARVLKDGTVQVNERSPAYLPQRQPLRRTRRCRRSPTPKAPPKWKTVDNSGTFLWHDHRMHYMSPATAAAGQGHEQENQGLRLRNPAADRRQEGRDPRHALLGRRRQHLEAAVHRRRRS